MKRTISIVLAVLALAACDDEQTKPATVPTGPSTVPMATQASAQAVEVYGVSTICRVYVTERDVAKGALDAAPTDTLQQRRVQMLDALVKETCN